MSQTSARYRAGGGDGASAGNRVDLASGAMGGSTQPSPLSFESGYLTNPPDCPTAGWDWIFDFFYEGGESVRAPVNVACTGAPNPPPSGNQNRAKACKTERVRLGADAFAAKYGTNRNGRNAFGKCVSGR